MTAATVRRFATPEALAHEAAAQFTVAAAESVSARGRFCVALPGGRTPVVLYRLLREPPWAGLVRWDLGHFVLSDERCVPLEDAASNGGLAQRELFDHVAVPAANLHWPPLDAGDAAAVAAAWERELRTFFSPDGSLPALDLAVLGVGADGHTASLFPGDPALSDGGRWVMPVGVRGAPEVSRVTLTLPVLGNARSVLFLAAGGDKREVIDAVGAGGARFPAARVKPPGGALWLYSEAAV